MSESGGELEQKGQAMFDRMGLFCCSDLADTQLTKLNPEGSYPKGDHLEIDYLIPVDGVCLVGEITSRSAAKCSDKIKMFARHLNAIDHALKTKKSQPARDALWQLLGVNAGDLRKFRNVRTIKGFAILTKIEQCEIPPQQTIANCIILYRYHWDLINEYAQTIGSWARHHFLELFQLAKPKEIMKKVLAFSANDGNLLAACDRYVTADRDQESHVVTFLANPYDLLPCSAVCRRDALPSLGGNQNRRYQRTLRRDKLEDIRTRLLSSNRFIFPNGVLAVLSKDCSFDSGEQFLTIPQRYGAMNIIDGQHRLFSYADPQVHQTLKDDASILVTAVAFDSVDAAYIERFSARTFIDINTNQTRVSSLLLYGIGYEVLGDPHPKNLAAHILRKVNERDNKLRGLLRTNDSPRGKIQSMEIIGSLGVLTNVQKMARWGDARGPAGDAKRNGVRELFRQPTSALTEPAAMTEAGIICLERYFNLVARIFPHDWPDPGPAVNGSAFELTKFFAALVKLLRGFIEQGTTWKDVEEALVAIRDNVLALRKRKTYKAVLFDTKDQKIPDATARISDMFSFLQANRRKPTTISAVARPP